MGLRTAVLGRLLFLIPILQIGFLSPILGQGRMDPDGSSSDRRTRNVLLLNSYHSGFPWTDALVSSIRSSLEEFPAEIQVWTEYLDAKRTDFQESDFLVAYLAEKYQKIRFDLIISTDDAALLFLFRYKEDLFGRTPVVFCGVNDQNLIMQLPRETYTGIQEVFDSEPILDLALRFHPAASLVVVVSENSVIGREQKQTFETIAAQRPGIEFQFLDGSELTLDEILSKLKGVPADALVLATSFTRDASDLYYPAAQAHRLIAAASAAPVYSPSISDLGQGIVAGSDNGGYDHGQLVGRLARRVLEGVPPGQIPIEQDRENRFVLDAGRLRDLGIDVSLLPPASRLLNQESTFYSEHSYLIWLTLGLIGVQSGVIILLAVNVGRRRRAEEELRSAGRRIRSVIEQSNDAIYILFQNRFDLVNRRFCELTGVTPEEAAADDFSFWGLLAPESVPLIRERSEKRAKGEEVADVYEFEILHRKGRKVHVEASVTEIEYRGGKAILGILRDVTEHRNLELQLNQAQKMESIGRLSGGVAHDLNNLLTPIIGYGEMLQGDPAIHDSNRESAGEIVQAAFRARDLVRQLLAFSRRQTLEFRSLDLGKMILEFENLLRRTVREDIQIRLRLAPSLPTIRGDRGQLEQVIMNLVVNAQDAMPGGGTLFIETTEVELDEEYAGKHTAVTPGRHVLLAVSDTGHGMDGETLARVFEPFFTTKEIGKGTGLGLATVYGIVKQHGGSVWVYSEPGEGTTFKCYFPEVDAPEPGREAVSAEQTALGGHETVMIVEDEKQLRELAATILRRRGYVVLVAENGSKCFEILRTHQGPLDLLLTDVVLPGLNGKEIFNEVVKHFPETRVLYMSGYTEDRVATRGILDEGIAFIQKPFSTKALAEKVRQVLDSD